ADALGAAGEDVRLNLEAGNVEARAVWKPMHLQPLFAGCRTVGGAVAEELFGDGLCLPSGSALTDAERTFVVETLLATKRRHMAPLVAVSGKPGPGIATRQGATSRARDLADDR